MTAALRKCTTLALLLGAGAAAAAAHAHGLDPDPALAAPGERIVFNRPCADEEPARVKAWARMETPRGEARAAVAVLAHARATRTGTVRVEVRLQRLEIDAGPEWADAPFTVRLAARSPHAAAQSGAFATWHEHEAGERRFRTDEAGTAHWITFVEPGEEAPAGSESAYRTGPDLSLDAAALRASGPRDEIALALVLRNAMNMATLELAGPRVRIPERIWATVAPPPRPLGLLATLNPAQEGGLLDTLRRGYRYRKCIEERRAAKRFHGPLVAPRHDADRGVSSRADR